MRLNGQLMVGCWYGWCLNETGQYYTRFNIQCKYSTIFDFKWNNRRWCAWDSNPWPQDGRRNFIKIGQSPASFVFIFVFSNKHYNFYNKYRYVNNSIQYMVQGLEHMTFSTWVPPITTRLVTKINCSFSGLLEFGEFCQLAAKFLVEEDEEALKKELKEAFRIYDKEGD